MTSKENKMAKKLKMGDLVMQALLDEMVNETNVITKIMKERSNKWLKKCEQQYKPHMRDAVHTIWKAFEWANDSKDALIKELIDTLIKEQTIISMHFEDTEKHGTSTVDEFNRISETTRKAVHYDVNMYNKNTNLDVKLYGKLDSMKTINFLTRNKKLGQFLLGELLNTKENILLANQNIRDSCAENAIEKIITIWDVYKDTVDDYRLAVNKQKVIEELSVKVNNVDDIIKNQTNQIVRLQETVIDYRNINEANAMKQKLVLAAIRKEHTALQKQYQRLYAKLKQDKDTTHELIKEVSWTSKQAICTLETITDKGKKILELHNKCKSFQTVNEQSVARPKFMLRDILETSMLWKKYGSVKIFINLMQLEKKRLLREKKKLEDHIETCLRKIGLDMQNISTHLRHI